MALLINTVPNFLMWECPHHCEFTGDAGDATMVSAWVAEVFQLLEQEAANLRGCRSRCQQQLKETRVWGPDWMDSVQNPLGERPSVCACVWNPQSASQEECQWDTRAAQVCPSVFRRVLEKPSVLLLVHRAGWVPCLTTNWAWRNRTKAATHQGRRNPLMSQSPTSSSHY